MNLFWNLYYKIVGFMVKKEDFFKEENKQKTVVELSDLEKYRLEISSFKTREGSWSYTQGKVFKVEDNKLIATINRNYHSFPFLFIENHSSGKDYLVCGEDYQGQTIVDLTTGEVLNKMSQGYEFGGGFCWADYKFYKDINILIVNGCHWACPYEYRFYDFSDPMNFKEIESEYYFYETGDNWPVISKDGVITYQEMNYADDEEEEPSVIEATHEYKIENGKIVKI